MPGVLPHSRANKGTWTMRYLYREQFDHKPAALRRIRYVGTLGFRARRRWRRPFSVKVFETVSRAGAGR
jgi:hypothetical protein